MITCLHTAEVHVATFSVLLPDATHIVRADFLDRARADGLDAVSGEVTETLKELSVTGPVLCTCSTLGPLVDAVGISSVVRIDGPAMEQAAAGGGEVVVAICLESTKDATLALFQEVAGHTSTAKLILCDAAWPFFEAGDMQGFSDEIVDAVSGQGTRILLAQASMAVATPALKDKGYQLFMTPKAAADAVSALA